jgi:hypothetical protein
MGQCFSWKPRRSPGEGPRLRLAGCQPAGGSPGCTVGGGAASWLACWQYAGGVAHSVAAGREESDQHDKSEGTAGGAWCCPGMGSSPSRAGADQTCSKQSARIPHFFLALFVRSWVERRAHFTHTQAKSLVRCGLRAARLIADPVAGRRVDSLDQRRPRRATLEEGNGSRRRAASARRRRVQLIPSPRATGRL